MTKSFFIGTSYMSYWEYTLLISEDLIGSSQGVIQLPLLKKRREREVLAYLCTLSLSLAFSLYYISVIVLEAKRRVNKNVEIIQVTSLFCIYTVMTRNDHMCSIFILGRIESRPLLLREIFVHLMCISLTWKRLASER